MEEEKKRLDAYATQIQKIWRGHRVRQEIKNKSKKVE